jgi:hypothetical protein
MKRQADGTPRREPELAPTNSESDCYSAGERGWMEQGQRLRQWMFEPLLRGLACLQLAPDHITLFALIAGLFFFPLFAVSPGAAFVALGLHVLLDGLDGPLARHLGTASRKGSFLDTFCDQLVVTVTTLTLMKAGVVGSLAGGFYVFLYAMVVFFAMVRNALGILSAAGFQDGDRIQQNPAADVRGCGPLAYAARDRR